MKKSLPWPRKRTGNAIYMLKRENLTSNFPAPFKVLGMKSKAIDTPTLHCYRWCDVMVNQSQASSIPQICNHPNVYGCHRGMTIPSDES